MKCTQNCFVFFEDQINYQLGNISWLVIIAFSARQGRRYTPFSFIGREWRGYQRTREHTIMALKAVPHLKLNIASYEFICQYYTTQRCKKNKSFHSLRSKQIVIIVSDKSSASYLYSNFYGYRNQPKRSSHFFWYDIGISILYRYI